MFQNKPSQPEPYHRFSAVFFVSTVFFGENSKRSEKTLQSGNNRRTLLPVTKDHLRAKNKQTNKKTECSLKRRLICHQTLNCSLSQFCSRHIVCRTVFLTSSRSKNVVGHAKKIPWRELVSCSLTADYLLKLTPPSCSHNGDFTFSTILNYLCKL